MSALKSFQLGSSLADAANERRRQKAQDAWLEEERSQKRLSWEEEARLRAEAARQREALAAARTGFITSLDEPQEAAVGGFLNNYGLRQPTVDPAASLEAGALGDATGLGVTRQAPAPMRYNTQSPELASLRRMAPLASTPQELAQLESARAAALARQDVSMLYDTVLNATPEQMTNFAQRFSNFKGVTGEIVPGANGISTLKLGEKSIPMDRTRMAQYVTAMYKLHKGDSTGVNDLASIDKDLAETMRKDFDVLRNTMTANNDAAYKGASLANDNARLGIQRTQANRERQDPLLQKIETLKKTLGRDLTEQEIMALGGLGQRGSEFEKLPEDGTAVRDRRGNVYHYKEGQPVLQGGFTATELATKFEEWGLPPQAETMVQPLPGGRHALVPADSETVYDLSNPQDRKMLKDAVDRVSRTSASTAELQARGGWAPRGTQGRAPVTNLSGYEQARQNAGALANRPLLGVQR